MLQHPQIWSEEFLQLPRNWVPSPVTKGLGSALGFNTHCPEWREFNDAIKVPPQPGIHIPMIQKHSIKTRGGTKFLAESAQQVLGEAQ